ncbi:MULTISPECIES: DegT/DnrJ/EryC1/StrS family aminotransferase [unclassified Streptomyces]|uniref:DegT/DnrJ/EryC1/StrS family aminotransferase n=1 Tax=unclassified Streptomyces TaxID=2593676 RepID=UPI002E2CF34C|nr:DegT/DnrJ/EryC1/StrS family aminotransferase [Streptomyces sp. NBC_01439]
MTNVPFFRNSTTWQQVRGSVETNIARSIDEGLPVDGVLVREVEEELARRLGCAGVRMTASGSDALLVLLRQQGIGPGDEVIVPAYTFFASVAAVIHVGARPVIVDIRPDSYTVSAEAVEKAVTERTKAVLAVHLFTTMADMERLGLLCEDRGLLLIEDSAQGIGMSRAGRVAGTAARGGVLSFFPSKTIGALGDAGAVIATDPAQLEQFDAILGRLDGSASVYGCDEIQAAVVQACLPLLDAFKDKRRELFAYYDGRLRDTEGVRQLPQLSPEDVGYVYVGEFDRRDELQAHLKARGITTEIFYPLPLSRQECLADVADCAQPVPVAEAASTRVLALPLYSDLLEEEAAHVCDSIVDFYRGA